MSATTVSVVTNDFKVKNPRLVKEVLEQLGFEVSITEDESILATAEEDNIDDTTQVVIDNGEVKVYSELLCNLEEMNKSKAITFTEFMQSQLFSKGYIAFYVVGVESRLSGVIDLWGCTTCITKKAQKHISLWNEVSKFLKEEGLEE